MVLGRKSDSLMLPMQCCDAVLRLGIVLVLILGVAPVSQADSRKNTSMERLEQTKQAAGTSGGNETRWVEGKTGQYLPLDLDFVDVDGQAIRLSEIIDRPTIPLPIYFYCPNICSRNLANLAATLNKLNMKAGEEYRAIVLSFNEAENSTDAARAKKTI